LKSWDQPSVQRCPRSVANEDAFTLLNVHLEPDDISPALERLANKMSKSI